MKLTLKILAVLAIAQGCVPKHCTHIRAFRQCKRNMNIVWIKPLQQWIGISNEWMECHAENIGFESPLPQKRWLPPNVIPSLIVYAVYYWLFYDFSIESLASGIGLHQLLSNWCHRPWSYWKKERGPIEADVL